MAEDENADIRPSWLDALRRVMERLDRAIPLPAGTSIRPTLHSGSVSRPSVGAIDDREPALEVMESPRSITLTIELPAVSRTEIDLRVTEKTLVVSASSPVRRYYSEIDLPATVRADSLMSTFENGVLDVVLEKTDDTRKAPRG